MRRIITGGRDWGSASCRARYDQPLHLAGHHLLVVAGHHLVVKAGLHVAVGTGHQLDDHDDDNDYVRFATGRGNVQNRKKNNNERCYIWNTNVSFQIFVVTNLGGYWGSWSTVIINHKMPFIFLHHIQYTNSLQGSAVHWSELTN